MQTKTKLFAALAGCMFAGSAFAAGDDVLMDGFIFNDYFAVTDALVFVDGSIEVDGASSAAVDQDQASLLNLIFGDGDMDASVSDDVARDFQGNLGINSAAGTGNNQANDAAISSTDTEDSFATAQVFNSQISAANIGTDFPSGPDAQLAYDAAISDDVLRDASGNAGVNVAAGQGNNQTNALAISSNAGNDAALATADSEQASVLNVLFVLDDLDATASVSGDVARGFTGNLGLNVAAGAGNNQHNGLAIATGGGY